MKTKKIEQIKQRNNNWIFSFILSVVIISIISTIITLIVLEELKSEEYLNCLNCNPDVLSQFKNPLSYILPILIIISFLFLIFRERKVKQALIEKEKAQ